MTDHLCAASSCCESESSFLKWKYRPKFWYLRARCGCDWHKKVNCLSHWLLFNIWGPAVRSGHKLLDCCRYKTTWDILTTLLKSLQPEASLLCATAANNQKKCSRYWHQLGTEATFGNSQGGEMFNHSQSTSKIFLFTSLFLGKSVQLLSSRILKTAAAHLAIVTY